MYCYINILNPFNYLNLGKVMGKQFDIIEYGVCYVEDILGEIPESSLIVSNSLSLTSVITLYLFTKLALLNCIFHNRMMTS